jgi:hypothetical protein
MSGCFHSDIKARVWGSFTNLHLIFLAPISLITKTQGNIHKLNRASSNPMFFRLYSHKNMDVLMVFAIY